MDIRSYSCNTSSSRSVRLGGYHQEIKPGNLSKSRSVSSAISSAASSSSKFIMSWKALCMKFLRKHKLRKIFASPATTSITHVPTYDPYTYSQNFDQGPRWDDEPENLSRSFSLRFSDPSRIFLRRDGVVNQVLI